jgi:hypothetical protein
MGVPISALLSTATLASTDNFPLSIGSALGDNRKISWANLQTLIQSLTGQVTQNVQTISYTNNNSAPVVITGHNVILGPGKWLLDFSSSVLSGGLLTQPKIEYYIVYNSNPLLTAYDVTDVTVSGSIRLQLIPFPPSTGNTCVYTKGEVITVPALGSYIVKVVVSDPLSADYIIQDRVLTAIKVS